MFSIASVIQNPAERVGAASLVLTTHESNERAMSATLKAAQCAVEHARRASVAAHRA